MDHLIMHPSLIGHPVNNTTNSYNYFNILWTNDITNATFFTNN